MQLNVQLYCECTNSTLPSIVLDNQVTLTQNIIERLKRYMFIFRISSRNVLLTWATPLHDNHAPIYNYRIFVRYVWCRKVHIVQYYLPIYNYRIFVRYVQLYEAVQYTVYSIIYKYTITKYSSVMCMFKAVQYTMYSIIYSYVSVMYNQKYNMYSKSNASTVSYIQMFTVQNFKVHHDACKISL